MEEATEDNTDQAMADIKVDMAVVDIPVADIQVVNIQEEFMVKQQFGKLLSICETLSIDSTYFCHTRYKL
jgi:hypothetical protein